MAVSTGLSTTKTVQSRTGAKGGTSVNALRPMPADFAKVAPGLSIRRLCRRYGTGWDVILRWLGEAGLESRSRRRRDTPADFVEHAKNMGVMALAEHYGACRRTIRRWLREAGCDHKLSRLRAKIPADLAVRAATMTGEQLARHYGVHRTTIGDWLGKAGLVAHRKSYPMAPPPADFDEVAPTMTRAGLREHYGVGYTVLTRWIADTGVEPAAAVYNRPPLRYVRQPGHSNVAALKANYTAEDHAADVLRRFGPVYRCNDTGRATQGGKFWRVGNVVLTGAELIARAARKAAA